MESDDSQAEDEITQEELGLNFKKSSSEIFTASDLFYSLSSKDNDALQISDLRNFCKQADNYSKNPDSQDIVHDFLELPESGNALISLLEDANIPPFKCTLVFKSLRHLLLRLSGDLSHMDQMGQDLVGCLLRLGMGSFCAHLANRHRPQGIKAALQLLTLVAAMGPQFAKELAAHFNVLSVPIATLLDMRSIKDPLDVHTCVIHFIMAFFVSEVNGVIRQICEQREILVAIICGLPLDKASVIQPFLLSLKTKVLENPTVSKTLKIRFLNEHTLQSVFKLLLWKGAKSPVEKKLLRKAKHENQAWIQEDASEEEVEIVREGAVQFLLVACASHKWGIIFHENSSQPGRNPNHILTKLLVSQQKAFEEASTRELLAKILKACPDLMSSYLNQIRACFEPRPSLPWTQAMQFIVRAVALQDLDKLLSQLDGEKDVDIVLKKVLNSLGLFVFNKKNIFNGLRAPEKFIRLSTTEFLIVVLTKLNELSEHQKTFKTINVDTLIVKVSQSLPSLEEALSIFLNKELKQSSNQQTLPEGVQLSMSDYLTKAVDLLVLYSFGISKLRGEESDAFLKLLSVIQKHKSTLSQETVATLHLKVLKIIITATTGTGLWDVQENQKEESPLYMLFNLYLQVSERSAADEVKELISGVFAPYDTFQSCPWELNVWLEVLRYLPTDQQVACMELLRRTVRLYLEQPHVYIDMVMECRLKTLGQAVVIDRSDITFEEMLNLYEQSWSLNSDAENCFQRTNFSPLIPAILKQLSVPKEEDNSLGYYHSYIQSVILEILHQQTNPEDLCLLIGEYRKVLPKVLPMYSLFWKPRSKEDDEKAWQKEDKFWKLHMEQLQEPTTVDHLMNAYVLIRQSSRGNAWTEKRALGQVLVQASNPNSLKETQSLLHQALLYLNTELQSVLMGSEINGVMILSSLVDKFMDILCSSNDEQAHLEAISTLLCHPITHSWFLTLSNAVSTPEHSHQIGKCSKLITSLVCTKLNYISHLEFNSQRVASLYEPFKSKLVKCVEAAFKDTTIDVHTVWDNIMKGILCCLKQLSVTEAAYLLNLLLSIPLADFSDFPKILKVLSQLLKYVVDCDSVDVSCGIKGPAIQVLFEAVLESFTFGIKSGYELDKYLLLFMKQNPVHSVAVSSDTLQELLDRRVAGSLQLVKILIQHSSVHFNALRVWLSQNHSSLVLWPASLCLQILNITLQRNVLEDPLLPVLAKIYWHCLSTLVAGGETQDVYQTLNVKNVLIGLLKKKLIQKESLKVVTEQLLGEGMSCEAAAAVPDVGRLRLLVQVFECLAASLPSFRVQDLTPEAALFKMHLLWLGTLLGDPKTPSNMLLEFSAHSLQLFETIQKDQLHDADFPDSKMWFKLVTQSLKRGLSCETSGVCLLNLLCKLCHLVYGERKLIPTTSDVMQLLHGHSSFLAIMTEDDSQFPLIKESMIDLMVTLVELDATCCKGEHFSSLLSSYRASLAPSDQKLLYLMKAYEVNGISMHGFRPFVWGPSALSYYSSIANSRLSLWKQPKLDDIIHLLDKEKLHQSTLYFPIEIQLQLEKKVLKTANFDLRPEEFQSLYDPRFLLLVFSHFLEPGSLVDCDQFIKSGCLAYLIASLSSQDDGLRSLGYQALGRLYQHLEGTRNRKGQIWQFILDSLRNALRKPNMQLSSIFTSFMVKLTSMLFEPADYLFKIIYKFVTLKPVIDVTNVPEFYTLFYSDDVHHHQHRTWVLELLLEGLRSSRDFHLCQKRFIFQILLSYCPSPICSTQNRVLILGILRTTLRIRSSALTLCRAQGLLAWFQALIANHIHAEHEHEIVSEVVHTLDVLWSTAQQPALKSVNTRTRPVNKITENKGIKEESSSDSESDDEDHVSNRRKRSKSAKVVTSKEIEEVSSSESHSDDEDQISNRRKRSKSAKEVTSRDVSENGVEVEQYIDVDSETDCINTGVKSKVKPKFVQNPPSSDSDDMLSVKATDKNAKPKRGKLEEETATDGNGLDEDILSSELMEVDVNKDSSGPVRHPFYAFFPNEFLLLGLALIDKNRFNSDLLTVNRLLKFTLECCSFIPNLKPFIPYLTAVHLECLVHIFTQMNEISLPQSSAELQNQELLRHQCRVNAVRLIMLVPPRIYVHSLKEKEVFSVVVTALRNRDADCEIILDACRWLTDCVGSQSSLMSVSVMQCAQLLLGKLSVCLGEASIISEPSSKLCNEIFSLVKLFLILLPKKRAVLMPTCNDVQENLEKNPHDFMESNFFRLVELATVIQEIFLQEVGSADSAKEFIARLSTCKEKGNCV